LPNSFGSGISEKREINSISWRCLRRFSGFYHRSQFTPQATPIYAKKFWVFEKILRWVQLKIMPSKLKQMANKDSRVIISNSILKFHENDRRVEYKKRWLEKFCDLQNPGYRTKIFEN
jgi:hypothetical protein